jgi:hypothetical protein
MPAPFKNEFFWDILNALVKNVPVKQITHKFGVGTATLAKYRDEYLDVEVKIKDTVVGPEQGTFSFMHDPRKRKRDFNPCHDGTFYERWIKR